MIDTKELRRLAQAALTGPDGVSLNWVKLLQDFQKEANPATISELLDRLERAESKCLEQARLNGIGSEREAALMAKFEAAEKERDWNAERLEDAIEELTALRAELKAAHAMALNGVEWKELAQKYEAEIKAMRQQAPIGEIRRPNSTGDYVCSEVWVPLPVGSKLYALPGAKGKEK